MEERSLVGKKLRKAVLDGADFSGFELIMVDFYKASLRNVNFKKAGILNVNMDNALLGGCNFEGARIYGTSMNGADLKKARLHGARLSGTSLREANLTDASLSDAGLSGACFSGASMRNSDLSGADLSGADLSGADLSGANVNGADLSGADLSQVIISGVDIYKAKLTGAVFFGVSGLTKEQVSFIEANGGLAYGKFKKRWNKISDTVIKSRRIKTELAVLAALFILSIAMYFSDPMHMSNDTVRIWAGRKYAEGKYAEAIALYQIAGRRNMKNYIYGNEDFRAQFAIAAIYRNNLKDFNSAVAVLEKLLELPNLSYEVASSIYNELGCTYREMGNIDKARKVFQTSLDKDPYGEQAYETKMALIDLLRREGRREEAVKAYESLLGEYRDSNDKMSNTYQMLGHTCGEMGKLDEAGKAFQSSIEKAPDRERAYGAKMGLIGILRREGRREEAVKAYRELSGIYKDSPDKTREIHINLAQTYREMGKNAEADAVTPK